MVYLWGEFYDKKTQISKTTKRQKKIGEVFEETWPFLQALL